MRDGVRRGEEGAIEPPSTLADEFGQRVWYVSLADRALDVAEDPELKCQKHVATIEV